MVSPFNSLHNILPLLGSNKHMTDPADDLDATDYNHQLNQQRCYNSYEATNIPSDSVVLLAWNNGRRSLGCVVRKFELFCNWADNSQFDLLKSPGHMGIFYGKSNLSHWVKSIDSGRDFINLVPVYFFDNLIVNNTHPKRMSVQKR